MKLYELKDHKRDIQCSYCHTYGHNKRNCPVMKAQWLANPQVHETYDHSSLVDINKTMFPTQYQNYWGDDSAKQQFRAHWTYMKKRFAPKVEKKAKKRRKAKCGFCGATTHNRRNCTKMKNFVYVLQETNKAYRSAFYDKFIEGMGLGAGALLSIKGYYDNGDAKVGIITSFPMGKIMFTNLKRSWSDYSTHLNIGVLVNGNKNNINLTRECFYRPLDVDDSDDIWRTFFGYYGSIQSVISPAPNRPTKEWFMGQAPCFDWVVKKRDQSTLMYEFSGLIKHFYPHDNLRRKLGASIYDHHYYTK